MTMFFVAQLATTLLLCLVLCRTPARGQNVVLELSYPLWNSVLVFGLDTDGTFLVFDEGHDGLSLNYLAKLAPNGTQLWVYDPYPSSLFPSFSQFWQDASSNVFLSGEAGVLKLANNGTRLAQWSFDTVLHPNLFVYDVAIDSAGFLYVTALVDYVYGYCVCQYSSNGTLLNIFNASPVPLGNNNNIHSLTIDASDNIYVSDGSRVVKFSTSGATLAILNDVSLFGTTDGIQSEFLAIDVHQRLYISCIYKGTNQIILVSPAGQVVGIAQLGSVAISNIQPDVWGNVYYLQSNLQGTTGNQYYTIGVVPNTSFVLPVSSSSSSHHSSSSPSGSSSTSSFPSSPLSPATSSSFPSLSLSSSRVLSSSFTPAGSSTGGAVTPSHSASSSSFPSSSISAATSSFVSSSLSPPQVLSSTASTPADSSTGVVVPSTGSSGTLSTGAIVGIAVGVAVGALLCCLLVLLILFFRKSQKQSTTGKGTSIEMADTLPPPPYEHRTSSASTPTAAPQATMSPFVLPLKSTASPGEDEKEPGGGPSFSLRPPVPSRPPSRTATYVPQPFQTAGSSTEGAVLSDPYEHDGEGTSTRAEGMP